MTVKPYAGTQAARYLRDRFDYAATGRDYMDALDDVIWERASEAVAMRKELSYLVNALATEAEVVGTSLARTAKRTNGHDSVFEPVARENLAAAVKALNAREYQLEQLCRAAELIGNMTVES
jgi:hypothetical protein